MAHCPQINDKTVRDKFNSIVTMFNGTPLSIEEFKSVELRDKREGNELTAMNIAYKVWDITMGENIPNTQEAIINLIKNNNTQSEEIQYNSNNEVLAPNGKVSKLYKDIEGLVEEQDNTTFNKGRKVTLYRGGKDAGQNAHEGYGDSTVEPTGTYYSPNKNYAAQYDFNKEGVKEVEVYLGKEMSSEMYYEELDKAVTNAVNILYNGIVPEADDSTKWREIKKEIDKHFENLGYDSVVFEELEEILILKKSNNKLNNTKQQSLQLYKQTRNKEFNQSTLFDNSNILKDENNEPILYNGEFMAIDFKRLEKELNITRKC